MHGVEDCDGHDDDPCDAAGRALALSIGALQGGLTRDMVRARLFAEAPPRIGRFELQRTLGRGATCTVFLGFDREHGRSVAVKVLRADRCPGPDAHDRWTREARALARVSHPNVVQLYERGSDDGRFYLAMEYVRGTTLSRWLRHSHAQAEIVAMFVAVGRGLEAAHRVGLCHRDFKPDNVIVGEDGRPRIVDFGIACLPEQAEVPEDAFGSSLGPDATSSGSSTIAGTPAYMSPEQCRGEPIDARSDQFSFCVALYEALFEQLPFAGGDVGWLLSERAAGRLHPVPNDPRVPAHVRAAIARGLAFDPTERWPSMGTLLDALASMPVSARRRGSRGLSSSFAVGLSVVSVLASSCRPVAEVEVPPSFATHR